MASVAVVCLDPLCLRDAVKLAKDLNLVFLSDFNDDFSIYLVLTPTCLQLRSIALGAPGPVSVDFIKGCLGHRIRFGGGRRQLIARAVGLRARSQYLPTVIDVTAGLGRDAYLLAYLGCNVTMVESSPIVVALLRDGLARAAKKPNFTSLKLRLVAADSIRYLKSLSKDEYPEVVYLDPMFPPLKKSALVKKEMRMLREVVGDDTNCEALFQLALDIAKNRVVVKRHRHGATIDATKPDLVFKGKSSRFDVYLSIRQE